jgi:gliding motility-associated-like protein
VIYTVVPVSAAGCEGESFTVTVTVNPRPKILDQQFETCSGESFSYLPIDNAPTEIIPLGTTYSWTFIDNVNVTGETNGTNQMQFEQLNLINITNINQIVVYTVTATSGSCSSTFEIQLTVKPKPFIPNPSGLTDTRCSGDTFVIIPQNGIPTSATIVPAGTTYSWTFVDNPNVTGETIGIGQPTITQVLTNLTNVNQSVQYTVTPLSGTCQGLPFTVVFWVEPKPFIPNVIETVCDGGSFILTPVNGLVPTTNTIIPDVTLYSWTFLDNPNVTGEANGINQPFFNSSILVNNALTVQTVTYTVTPTYYVPSNPGIPRCIGDPFTITVSVNPGVDDNAVISNIACSYSPLCGGSIVLNPVGVGPFTYVWTYSGTGINAITDPALQNQLNLCPGNYQVEITDSLNCTYTFNYVIQPPTPIVSSLVTLQNISCNNVNIPPCDGYIELAVTGGTPFATPNASGQVYIFEWYKETPLGSGNFTLITSGSPILMNACVGNYKLKVVDANGCIHWSVPYLIENQFTLINIVETISNYNGFEIACNGGNSGYVHNVLSGGSGTYNYVFLNQTTGSIISQGVVNAPIPTPPGSINLNFDNLVSGTYQLTITDPFCPNNIVRTYVLDAPTQLQSSFTLVSLPVQCYNGTATYNVTATGGVGPYNGTGNYTLAAGVHTIVVTDSNGCTSTQVITVTEPTELQIQATVTSPILCFGGTAQVTVTATGGTGAYTGTGTFTVTAGGPYNYTVTDANGCTKQVSITVTQPSQLTFVIDSAQNPNCDPDRSYSNGSICITISGGTNPTPVGAGWVNIGGNKWCLNNLSAGNYSINVTDVNSCVSTGVQNVTLTSPTPLQAFINTNIQVNCATSTVTQNNYVFANGGTPPYTFTWSGGVACNPANPQCMTTTINGNYIAYVNDAEGIANGCPPVEVPFVVNLIQIGEPSFTYDSYAFTNCNGLAINDPIQFTNTSTGNYSSISWTINGQAISTQESFIHSFDEEGDYTVTLTVNYTIAGITCTYTTTEIIKITKGYDIIVPNAFTPNGDGINDTIRPIFKCIDKMEMSIYDTWGSLLYFEEGLSLLGWDGTIDGKQAENGNYIIVVRATTFAGKELFINGPVTLIK